MAQKSRHVRVTEVIIHRTIQEDIFGSLILVSLSCIKYFSFHADMSRHGWGVERFIWQGIQTLFFVNYLTDFLISRP